jgi:predicted ArsR family transcriptional regulator
MPVLGRAARPGRAELERLILERLCRPIGWRAELSSVDAAESFGVSVAQAQHVLRELEKLGMLDSELRPAPRTGLGRRYYWLSAAERTP